VLANLSYFFGAPPAPPAAAVAPAPLPPAPTSINPSAGAAIASTQSFVVYFDTGHATLTPQGRRVADDAVAAFKSSKATHVAIAGFTDTTGGARANEALSRRRAETVRDYLVAHGVPLSEMAVGWHGETDLRVATGNGVAQPQNRRVEINIP
jgi:OmpA-OmpF porin, OOP family